MSRERLKLLFKQHCEPLNGAIALKVTHTHLPHNSPVDTPDSPVLSATCLSVCQPSTVSKYRLGEQNFSQFFPDDSPLLPFSPASKGGARGSGQVSQVCFCRPLVGRASTEPCSSLPLLQGCSSLQRSAEKLQLQQQREQMAAEDRSRLRREKEEAQEAKRREREDRERLKEEQRRRFEDEKQRRREEKERRKLEREKVSEWRRSKLGERVASERHLTTSHPSRNERS